MGNKTVGLEKDSIHLVVKVREILNSTGSPDGNIWCTFLACTLSKAAYMLTSINLSGDPI